MWQHVLVVALHLVEPVHGAQLYDRIPLNPEMTRWAGEERSQRGFRQLLMQLGMKPTVEGIDHAYMLDVPFRSAVGGLAAVVRDCASSEEREVEMYEVPQEEMEAADRGVWRTYIVVVRGGQLEPGRVAIRGGAQGSADCHPFLLETGEEKP